MWAIRRASNQFGNKGLPSRSGRIFRGKTELAGCCSETSTAAIIAPRETIFDGLLSCTRFYSKSSGFPKSNKGVRTFSSQVDAKSNGEDLEDGFSELETPHDTVEEAASGDESDGGLGSGSELSEDEGNADGELNELETPGPETDVKKKLTTAKASSPMCKAILADPALPVSKVLDKWIEDGNEVTQSEALLAMDTLRRRRLYVKALQLSEWLESNKHAEFTDANHVSRVDLIAKVQGFFKAENYVKNLPVSLRTETVYRTLLANAVSAANVRKAEELFNKIKGLGHPISSFSFNQLLLLYKRIDRKKIADVLLLMEKENIKPSVFTYQILVDVKGQSNDITGMEQIVETMVAEGLKPSSQIQTSMARYYAYAGLKDKAEALLKEIEGDGLEKNRWSCRLLMPIYATLGKADEVERVWKFCESEPRFEDCLAAIEAWGQLKKIEKAEEAFDRLVQKVKKPSTKQYNALLKVYSNHKMLTKGKELVNQMAISGCHLGPQTWDALVKLYIGAGEVEKADSILEKAIKKKMGKPMFSSYLAIMDKYAERGDVHNAEKIFEMMKNSGYESRIRQYQSLLNAYVKAKKPAYGFRDRMKADNVFPSKALNAELRKIDLFGKSPVDDLFD
ncbi:pentatricopeptide repeat-containing protein At1g80270, mitochondrial-like [Salvia miltiorrhiza]|uniref:pentatricopeptide repeat-containing protein At1g80270, mitochondrial-like n=1 Tax=Salvia miltiorrhiza TaxID=226208 RepID=UPI0025ACFEA0|nr:pentatricopeptide repeat-containing protein At1g80270, mitochondrial-like [Salvia miltiorrhiza]